MTIEKATLELSMAINILVSFIKILSGIICNSKSMLADGFYSLSDLITDIVALIGTKLSRKRANKNHPDGYGRIEYLVNIFIASVIFLLGVYTIINSFSKEPITTNPIWIAVLIFTIVCKMISSKILTQKGIELQSSILVASGKESHDDAISSLVVIIIIMISSFEVYLPILKYADMIGSIILGTMILKTAIELYKEDLNLLVGTSEKNIEVENKIKEIINNYKEIEFKNIELERHGNYYVLELDIYVLKNIKVFELLSIEKEIRNKIKKLVYRIKFVDINLSQKNI